MIGNNYGVVECHSVNSSTVTCLRNACYGLLILKSAILHGTVTGTG